VVVVVDAAPHRAVVRVSRTAVALVNGFFVLWHGERYRFLRPVRVWAIGTCLHILYLGERDDEFHKAAFDWPLDMQAL
jgi:hypothetical protein